MSFYYETTFPQKFIQGMRMYMGENNGELCLVFPSLSVVPISVLPPSCHLKDPFLLQAECQEEHKPQTHWVYIAATVLIYLRSCCQLEELQK